MIIGVLSSGSVLMASAASSQTATIAGATINARSSVTATNGSASTASVSYDANVSASVSSTYVYVHPISGASGQQSQSNNGIASASVYFAAPTNYRSLSVQSSHSASKSGQNWSTTTGTSYYQ